jgi:hypothetical protein
MTNVMARSVMARTVVLIVGVAVVAGSLLAFVFRAPGDRTAILVSALVASAVQLAAFAIGHRVGQGNVMARMGAGMLLRFLTLVGYALAVAFVIKLPLAPALISLAVFYFLSTLLEPLLIKS